ncbi:hypothetical protein Tco_0734433, partial [Tanacetum coccineum]
MVDISDDVDLVNYDSDDEENPEEDPEEDPEEEPEPNNGLVNRFAPHVDPHQPGVMIGWLEENDGVNEGVNNEDMKTEDMKRRADVAPEVTFVELSPKVLMWFAETFRFPRGVFEASRARSRVTEAELGTCQTEIALLKSKNKIGEKEREIPNHDLENVEHVLGDILERLKVLESKENATSKKKLVEAEMKLELARMEHDMMERRLHASYGWN